VDGEDAETDLSMDRAKFLQRHDIMALIPKHIKRHIIHPGDRGQIHGFQELFVYLENSSVALELRQLVAAYFAESPELRPHLSMIILRDIFALNSPNLLALLQDTLPPSPRVSGATQQLNRFQR
jgi:hypothetical protein